MEKVTCSRLRLIKFLKSKYRKAFKSASTDSQSGHEKAVFLIGPFQIQAKFKKCSDTVSGLQNFTFLVLVRDQSN
jgi:hypothetical protein